MKPVLFVITLSLVFSFSGLAQNATPKKMTPVYRLKGKKLRPMGKARPGKRLKVLGRTKNKKWVVVAFNGHKGWVQRNRVQLSGSREVASHSTASLGGNPQNVMITAGPSVMTASWGIGLGAGATFKAMDKVWNNPLEVGGYAAFYPSTGGGSGFSISAVASTMLLGTRNKGIGAEAGLSYFHSTVSVPGITIPGFPSFSTESTSFSSGAIGLTMGPIGRYPISESIYLSGGIRLHVMSGAAIQIHAGVAFGL